MIFMKKTEYITYRTDGETKEALEKIAEQKKWSISFVVEQIVQMWLQEHSEQDILKPAAVLALMRREKRQHFCSGCIRKDLRAGLCAQETIQRVAISKTCFRK